VREEGVRTEVDSGCVGAGRFETFEHGADVGVRGFGGTVAEAFEEAARALASVVVDLSTVERDCEVDIECSAEDLELLLLDFLNELVFQMSAHGLVFTCFEVRIDGLHLRARAFGERVELARHQPAVEVKGATCTELSVAQREDGVWVAQCVVDV
jgi:tRNA nucleotidyltransferase (CCA-adding enzyme)